MVNNQYVKPHLSLRDFQRQAVEFLLSKKVALLALPTGTGKTITALTTYCNLLKNNPKLKLIYITEKPLIRQLVEQDLSNYFNLTHSFVYNNTKPQRIEIYNTFAQYSNVLVVNYASIRQDFNDIGAILQKNNLDFITIYDEATNFRTPTTQIAKNIMLLCKASQRAYAMTATPASRSLIDIYNILDTLGMPPYSSKAEFERIHANYTLKKMFLFRAGTLKAVAIARPSEDGKTHTAFVSLRNKFKLQGNVKLLTKSILGQFKIINENNASFSWSVKPETYAKVTLLMLVNGRKLAVQVSIFDEKSSVGYKNLKLFTQTTKDSLFVRGKHEIVKELPPLTITTHYTDECEKAKDAIKYLYQKEQFSASQIEIATNTPQVYLENIPPLYKSDKIQRVIDFIKNDLQTEKVIIYYPYTQTLQVLKNILAKEFETQIAYYTGEVKDSQKQIEMFLNDANCQILLATNTILRGHNIQSVNHIIALQPPYTAENVIQLVGRINRIGGTYEPKFLHYFLNQGTRDEDIYTSLNAQLKHIKQINPQFIEDGLIHENSEMQMSEAQAKIYLDNQLRQRKTIYV